MSGPTNPPSSGTTPKAVPRSKPLYLAGIALTILGFVFGLALIVLHYETVCSASNIFACHSLYNPSGGNFLPYLVGIAAVIFVIGVALGFVYGPRTPVTAKGSTAQADKTTPG